ncbi:MAG: PAS domain S-box protein [bacterium]
MADAILNPERKIEDLEIEVGIFKDAYFQLKKTKGELQASEEQLRSILENMLDGVLIAELRTKRFIIANNSICRMLGYTREELLQLGVSSIHPEKDLPYVVDQFEKQANKEITVAKDIPVLRKDGTIFFADVNSAPLLLNGKKCLLGVFRDITERKKAEGQIKEEKKKLSDIMDNMVDGVTITDMKGVITSVNKATEDQFGYSEEELVGKTPGEMLLAKLEAPKFFKTVERMIKVGVVSGEEFVGKKKDGTEFPISVNLSVLTNEAGRPQATIAVHRDITERKKSERKYKALYDSSHDAIMTLAPPTWNFTAGNRASIEMFAAKDEADFVSRGPWEYSPEFQPDGRPSKDKAKEMIMKAMKEGSNFFKWTHKRLGGKDFPATVLLTKVKIGSDEFLQATVRDITAQEKVSNAKVKLAADLSKRVSELRVMYGVSNALQKIGEDTDAVMRHIVNLIPIGCQYPEIVCVKISLGEASWQSENFKTTQWGRSANIVVSGKVAGKVDVNYLKEYPEMIKEVFTKEEKQLFGRIAKEIGQWMGKRKAEKERRESEESYRELVRAVVDGIVAIDKKMNVVLWNPAAEKIFGYSEKEMLGQSLIKIVPERHRKNKEKGFVQFLQTGKGPVLGNSVETEGVRNDGKEVPIELTVSGGGVSGEAVAIATVRDITERKKAEHEIRELDLLKSRFITALTHVTRTPLNQIRWSLESLLSGEFNHLKDNQQILVRKALASEEAVLRVIRNMNLTLDIERKTMVLEQAPTSVVSLVKSVAETFKDACNLKGINHTIIMPKKDFSSVDIDAEKIRIAVEAICDNAIRYTPEKGLIEVKFVKTKTGVAVKVADTGVGIPKAEQGHIFERFFRASNAQSMYPDGVGLGLYIAKSIIEKHDGTIGFKSEEGKGSTFWFELPAQA